MRILSTAIIGVLVACPAVPQGALAPGFAGQLHYRETAFPSAFHGFAPGDGGFSFVAAADEVVEIDPLGGRRLLHRFPPGSAAGLLTRPGMSSHLYFVEGTTSRAWRHDIGVGAKVAGSVPVNTFDLERAPGGQLLASANPAWPSPSARTGIWLVDFGGGAHREVAKLRGPSGPIAFDRGGNLYYAEQSSTYPAPPGGTTLWRFDAALVSTALAGGTPLTMQNATPTATGLDGAFDLALDDQSRLYASNPQDGSVQRTLPGPGALEATHWLDRPAPPSTAVALQLHYLEGDAATFTGYQPAPAGTMLVVFVDFLVSAEVHSFTPIRPLVVSSPATTAPAGPVTFRTDGLPSNAACWLWVSPLPAVPETPWLYWSGTPFWSGLDPALSPIAVTGIADATGHWSLPMVHPGGFGAQLQFQAAGVGTGNLFGTSAIYSLRLQP